MRGRNGEKADGEAENFNLLVLRYWKVAKVRYGEIWIRWISFFSANAAKSLFFAIFSRFRLDRLSTENTIPLWGYIHSGKLNHRPTRCHWKKPIWSSGASSQNQVSDPKPPPLGMLVTWGLRGTVNGALVSQTECPGSDPGDGGFFDSKIVRTLLSDLPVVPKKLLMVGRHSTMDKHSSLSSCGPALSWDHRRNPIFWGDYPPQQQQG